MKITTNWKPQIPLCSYNGILRQQQKKWLDVSKKYYVQPKKKQNKTQKPRHKRVNIVWFHSNEVLE